MNPSLIIKIVVFIILAIFASWPYFEDFKSYTWLKRALIGVPIILLLTLGIMDIIDTDAQAKNDKNEIKNSNSTIATLSNSVAHLSNKLDSMEHDEKHREDREDRRDSVMLALKTTIELQQANGNISKSLH